VTPKQRLENLIHNRAIDRPPFFPALYDYKAALAKKPSHLFGTNADELIGALKREAADLSAEMLTVAYDIYNIEAEALGGKIRRDPGIVMPEMEAPILSAFDALERLQEIKAPAGRMDLFIKAAAALQQETGDTVPVRGGISGPFSMASKIYPREQLLMDTVMNPDGVRDLLAFCTRVIKVYARGFIDAGTGVVVFDSFIAPPMLSPAIYEELILPFHQDLFSFLKENNVIHRPLIAGGDISPLLPALTRTGANQLLLDYNIPVEKTRELMQEYNRMLFRVNLSPSLVADGRPEEITNETNRVLSELKDRKNLIMGTGILPQNTPEENILQVKETIVDFYN
jgi:uroporphyrinogen decarboxylase